MPYARRGCLSAVSQQYRHHCVDCFNGKGVGERPLPPRCPLHAPTARRIAARRFATVSASSLNAFAVRCNSGKPRPANESTWLGGSGETPGDARSRGVDEIADGLRSKKASRPQRMARVFCVSTMRHAARCRRRQANASAPMAPMPSKTTLAGSGTAWMPMPELVP